MKRSAERFWFWLAWRLPRPLVYFATVRAAAHATQGPYEDTVVPSLTVIQALERWEKTPA
jgi:hypothetical protein